jgi:hypothetical protein
MLIFLKNTTLTTHLILVFVFGILYWLAGFVETYYQIKSVDTDTYIQPIGLFDAFYFSLVTQTTVGYGNVFPQTRFAQVINIIQLIGILYIYI